MALAFRNRTARAARPLALTPMAEEVRAGLLSDPPYIPSKYFYDDKGSALFEEITQLPEYYQTRTEEAILAEVADHVIGRVRPREIVELGSGAGRKIRLLLDALLLRERHRQQSRPKLILLDINARFVHDSARVLESDYAEVDVEGVVGDFTGTLDELGPGGGRLVVLFAGTIGNLVPGEATRFLRRTSRHLAPGDGFLVGLDLVKDPARIERAYNDATGVTAAFNLNILEHVNRELSADFDVRRWRHRAFYDATNEWIEMRLVSTAHQRVHVRDAGLELTFARGDEILTEYSCKYSRDSFTRLLIGTGLRVGAWYQDADDRFALALLEREDA